MSTTSKFRNCLGCNFPWEHRLVRSGSCYNSCVCWDCTGDCWQEVAPAILSSWLMVNWPGQEPVEQTFLLPLLERKN
ncbi:hypothetical protein AV530_016863 [Patagioenas fasciata monilis]|uniref:Uncharacterized protein n=1 Tax=Patagioenas fasciata monilis TaxID=372326 RepID=A0A1V4J3V0_PATFA|nr:hypothetical protein AV530_016863 [Patagioenas fasciata monilis]